MTKLHSDMTNNILNILQQYLTGIITKVMKSLKNNGIMAQTQTDCISKNKT
jgi:hypothetical protein